MKKLSTIQSLFVLAIFALTFTSCDIGDISTKVSIRFENVSAQDIQLVTVDGLVIDEIKAGETTDYFEFKDIEVNYMNQPNFDITSDAFNQTYSYTYQDYFYFYCGIAPGGCFGGDYSEPENQETTMLAKGNYTLQLNADVRAQATNNPKQLVVNLVGYNIE